MHTFDPTDHRRGFLQLLNEDELADVIGVKPQTLQVWRTRRQGPPFVKLGKQVYYRNRDIEDWIAANVTINDDPPANDNEPEKPFSTIIGAPFFDRSSDPDSPGYRGAEPEILTSGEAA